MNIIMIVIIFILLIVLVIGYSYLNSSHHVKFGDVCGIALGGIPAYSCKTTETSMLKHEYNGVYYGIKYQCVEFVRRWLIQVYGLTLDDVEMAYEIFDLPYAIKLQNKTLIIWNNVQNGSSPRPVPGSLLVWGKGGRFGETGHVAIVTEVSDQWIRIAEQNVHNTKWPYGRNYARELSVEYDANTGNYLIHDELGEILGWKNLPQDLQL
jgi:glutathionylspermidine amidase/synthetase